MSRSDMGKMEIVIHRIDEWVRESMMLGKQKNLPVAVRDPWYSR
jgi:hypothetical protein